MLNISKEETMLLILTFFIRHNLTKVALVDLLKLINLIIGIRSLPETHYMFMKCCSNSFEFCKNYYCSKCNLYIGKLQDDFLDQFVCSNCLNAKTKYFISNSIGNKLKDIICINYKNIMDYKKSLTTDYLSDIVKGQFMKSYIKIRNFSISINTDGVALYKSHLKKSFWPIIISLNDLPPKLRYLKKNMIVAGLWLDDKMLLEVFLKPLIDELKILYDKGITIKNNCYKIISSAICVDSVARCKILKMKQFNGSFGCTYCKHPGDKIKIGGN